MVHSESWLRPGGGDCGMTVTCRNLIAGFPKGEQYPEGGAIRIPDACLRYALTICGQVMSGVYLQY